MAASTLKVPFGKRGNQLFDIHSVERGLACDCICPSCGSPLIANHGDQKQKYFSHSKSADCALGYETALHEMSKQILREARSIRAPELVCPIFEYRSSEKDIQVIPEQILAWPDEGLSEINIADVRPDFFAKTLSGDLIVEIAVTHRCDPIKMQKLGFLNLAAIEIDLSNLPRVSDKEELRKKLIDELYGKSWLTHPSLEAAKAKANEIRIAFENESAIAAAAAEAEFRIEQLEKRKIQKVKDDILKKRVHKVQINNRNFKESTIKHKENFVSTKLGLNENELPAQINAKVRFSNSFCVPQWVWQGDIFRRFILKEKDLESDRQLSLESLSKWAQERYDIKGKFPTSYKIALWDYLVFLTQHGYLDKKLNQNFYIKRSFW